MYEEESLMSLWPFTYFKVSKWPKEYRRIYILLLPISLPIWIILFSLVFVSTFIVAAVITLYFDLIHDPIKSLLGMWND